MVKSTLNRLASRIALVAIIFASLAPTISHAFPAKNSTSFQQEICDSNGVKRLVNVDFAGEKKPSPEQNQAAIHLEHCPYCAAHMAHVDVAKAATAIFLAELNTANRIDLYTAPLVQSFYPVSHPSHAPPLV